eukprot:2932348-Pleurochrysis_carterae.AAC.2
MTSPSSTSMRRTLPTTTSSSSPTMLRTASRTSASRRRSIGSPLSPAFCCRGRQGFPHNDKLAFVAEYVLEFGLLCASN